MSIVKAAVRDKNGGIYTGRRHLQILKLVPPELVKDSEEGFLTDKGVFVDREEAAIIAFLCGQIREELNELQSIDLW